MAAAKKRKKKKAAGWHGRVLLVVSILAAVAAMSTSVLLLIGMLPTIVAVFIDRTADKTRALSVGALNLAGCMPFVLQLWTTDTSLESALVIITDPRTIIVMYCAAGVGYLVDWAVAGLVGTVMVQRATSRRDQIKKTQADMVTRWGIEVTGDVPVDEHGFPLVAEDGAKK